MPVTDYFGQTAYAGRISELAINEALRDRIVADGGTPVRDGAQLQAQDTFPRLLEQAMSLMAGKGNGWAANARAVTATGAVAIAAATDDGMFVDVDANGASRAVNLPDAANLRQGWNCVIRKSDGVTADVLTLTPDAGDTITGPTTLTDQFSALFVCRTGPTTWAAIKIAESQVGLGWASNTRLVAAIGPISISATDDGLYVGADPGGANRAVNLPSAAGLRAGWNCVIRKDALPGDTFTLTLTPNGGDTISGPTVISSPHDAIMLVRVGGTSWATMRLRGDSGLGWASEARTTIGGDVAVMATNDGACVDADPAGANRLVSLPSAAGLRTGWNFTIRKGGPIGSPETLTLTPNGADTIDGPTVLYNTFDALFVVRTGATSWASFKVSSEPRNNFDAVADPTVNDDNTLGYGRWSRWVNTLTGSLFACSDNTTGAAVWVALGVAGALMCFFLGGFYGNRMAEAFAAVVPGGGYA